MKTRLGIIIALCSFYVLILHNSLFFTVAFFFVGLMSAAWLMQKTDDDLHSEEYNIASQYLSAAGRAMSTYKDVLMREDEHDVEIIWPYNEGNYQHDKWFIVLVDGVRRGEVHLVSCMSLILSVLTKPELREFIKQARSMYECDQLSAGFYQQLMGNFRDSATGRSNGNYSVRVIEDEAFDV